MGEGRRFSLAPATGRCDEHNRLAVPLTHADGRMLAVPVRTTFWQSGCPARITASPSLYLWGKLRSHMQDDSSSNMAASNAASNAPLVDAAALSTYLDQAFPESAERPIMVERVRGGHSNETFFITRGEQEWVLRRPPRGPLLPTAHDVAREYRVLTALVNTPVPVPRPVLLCANTSVI